MKFFRIVSGVWAALFVYAATVQYNDPDPLRWIALYGSAAYAALRGAMMPRPGWLIPGGIFVVAFGWALLLVPGVLAHAPPADALFEYRMLNLAVEEARELLGLLLVSAWMVAVAGAHWRTRPRRAVRPQRAG